MNSCSQYQCLVFDCDSVVLDSNKVKTKAFYQATLPYGKAAAQAMVNYHVANGGVSRYKKFAHFLEQIAPNIAFNYTEQQGPDLEALRQQTPNARWLIVSGGDQAELRDVFAQRGIAEWFDGGIFGSPDTKDEILARELASGNIQQPALFLGDSKYDYQAASAAGLDFVFVSGWSEVERWEAWVNQQKIKSVASLSELA
ncbi:HAD family hydrolase [Thiorhodospira sibirica]|uniref:HAD family hydrolase n=1 Tax=Thiorhodospira sibirica TaxID=154347 RepID=UPI00022C2E0C|nr:HAD-IA family hydrolase [Thiorhodospira sibirica]